MKTFKRLINYARPFRRFLPSYLTISVFGSIFGIVNFTLLIPLLNLLFGIDKPKVLQTEAPDFFFGIDYFTQYFNYWFYSMVKQEGGEFRALWMVCLVILISVILSNIFYYLGQRLLGNMRANIISVIRRELYQKIMRLHVGYYSNERKGDIISRLTNDVQEVENSIISVLTLVVRDPLTIVFVFFTLFKIDVQLTLFTLFVLPASGLAIGEITKRLKKTSNKGQNVLGQILGVIDETIVGMRVVKAFNAQGYVYSKFDKYNSNYSNLLRKMNNLRELASPASQILGVSVVLGIMLYGGKLVLDDTSNLSAAEFMTFIVLFAMVLTPIKAMTSALSTIQRGLASAERIFELLDHPILIQNKSNALKIKSFEKDISLKNLVFRYEAEREVLKSINLTIPKGKTVALVGPSGGGKSTLMDLIPRFHDPASGQVLIDGIDLKDYEVDSVRNLMGIVTQESILFNDTIFNNIAFGIEATIDQVIQAAKIANAHEFIEKTENGYYTEIGDRGMKLSGGQRQRITIARAILKNPPILLLDEATSALDSESEHLVQDALNKLMQNRTSIVIAHRFSTIQSADLIIVLNEGKVEEQGSHEELMQKDGLYKKLSEMQSV